MPMLRNATVEPDTVHTDVVLELNATGKPEVAVADNVTGVPVTAPVGAGKLIVWLSKPIANDCMDWEAAL